MNINEEFVSFSAEARPLSTDNENCTALDAQLAAYDASFDDVVEWGMKNLKLERK